MIRQPQILRHWSRGNLAILAMLIMLALAPAMAAADVLPLTMDLDSVSAAPYSESLEDPSRALTIEDVLKEPWRSKFQHVVETGAKKGMTRSAWWVNFEMSNQQAQTIEWIAEAVFPLTSTIDFYAVNEDGTIRSAETGMTRPVDSTRIERFIFSGDTAPGSRTRLFVRFAFAEIGINDTQITVWSKHAFHASRHNDLLILGVIIGAGVTALIFNYIFYRSSRTPAYLWYVGYISAGLATLLYYSGLFRRFLGPPSPYFAAALPIWGPALAYAFAAQFTRLFLGTRQLMPRSDRALKAMILLISLGLFASVVGFRAFAVFSLIVVSLSLCLLPLIGLQAWRLGRTEARIFTLAWSLWSVGTAIGVLRLLGIVPNEPLLWWIARTCVTLEAIGLSFALFDQISGLKRQALEAEHGARLMLERANVALEAKVRERTAELLQKTHAAEALARTDALTGIPNRRAFLEQADFLLQLCIRHSHPMSFVMIDIDHFKSINDNCGHSAGDDVIRSIAATLVQRVRATDVVGRIGGEEFAIAMPETALGYAVRVAEELRLSVSGTTIRSGVSAIQCTASLGVAAYDPGTGKFTLEQLMRRADVALYAAKNNGRNQVVQA